MTKGEVDHPLTPSSTPLFLSFYSNLRVKKLGGSIFVSSHDTREEWKLGWEEASLFFGTIKRCWYRLVSRTDYIERA